MQKSILLWLSSSNLVLVNMLIYFTQQDMEASTYVCSTYAELFRKVMVDRVVSVLYGEGDMLMVMVICRFGLVSIGESSVDCPEI